MVNFTIQVSDANATLAVIFFRLCAQKDIIAKWSKHVSLILQEDSSTFDEIGSRFIGTQKIKRRKLCGEKSYHVERL